MSTEHEFYVGQRVLCTVEHAFWDALVGEIESIEGDLCIVNFVGQRFGLSLDELQPYGRAPA